MPTEKIIIIGSGPAGLSAAIYLARAGFNPLIITGVPSGGQLMLTAEVENYPGFEKILGPDLILKMKNQAVKFGARLVEENIIKVDFSNRQLILFDESQRKYQVESVLIATGSVAQWLNLKSEKRLRGKGVSACAVCDGFFFRDKVVGVVGGGDSAMEEALTLTKFAKKVYIIHRRDKFRASQIMQERAFKNPKIEIIWNAQVEEILGKEKVEGIKLSINPKSLPAQAGKIQNPNDQNSKRLENSDLEIRILPLDGLFIAIGHKPATEFLQGSGVELDEKGYVLTAGAGAFKKLKNPNYQLPRLRRSVVKAMERRRQGFGGQATANYEYQYMTFVDGVFAAGDVIDSNYRQAATAVGTGVAAALEIERYLSEK